VQVDARITDPRGKALLSRIHRRHATVTEEVRVGSGTILFTRIADPNRVLDEVAEAEDLRDKLEGKRRENPLHLPYWAELWDSALGVAQFLVGTGSPRPRGPNEERTQGGETPPLLVLDLGCGMGLCGTVAAAMGWNVLFADLEAEALLFARLNSISNSSRVRTRQLNWQTDKLSERFDLIIGADILYERKQWEHLERFWTHHLNVGGSIVLGEPGRQTGTFFIDWVDRKKWKLEQFSEPVTTRSTPIRIFQLRTQRA
jgi:predicted nicotinamide N-methyase